MFGKKQNANSNINRQIVGFTKARKILFFTIKPKPIYKNVEAAAAAPTAAAGQQAAPEAAPAVPQKAARSKTAMRTASRHPELAASLVELGMKITPEAYITSCTTRAAIVGMIAALLVGLITLLSGAFTTALVIVFAALFGMIGYLMAYQTFFRYPMSRTRSMGKDVEKDILFAARDMIVSMRSGLPLFNAMATVSVGYGAASKEFEKIIDRVQLGMPMEQAIDEVSSKSQSKTFKRLMLQASTSIRVGADVIGSIQEVINDVSQERIIELRRYGQKLNAIAMFYMLFGIIFPSMGLAVASIMSTFISFIPITNSTLVIAAVVLVGLQVVFLNLVASSRPSFTM